MVEGLSRCRHISTPSSFSPAPRRAVASSSTSSAVRYRVEPADIDEIRASDESPAVFAQRIARDKALRVAGSHRLPVLAADTVVAVGDDALGKPAGPADAAAMLRRLSGRAHMVHTGVALALRDRCESLVDSAAVHFAPLDDESIDWYVATGEPLDKAGAYAVQGAASLFITSVEGSPQTVIGLPLHRLPALFTSLGLDFRALIRPRSQHPS